jgi:hypothetical protein
MTTPKIITTFVYPPIPIRSMDWQAHYDDDEPNDDGQMATGSGQTEAEAIQDLIDNHPREDRTMWKPDVCIYHGNCDDGFGAAWAIWRRWGNEVAYFPGVYGKAPPDVAGKNVLLVDFSYKYDVLTEMSFKARSLVIIDHHKTAEEDLKRLPSFDGSMADLDSAFKICWTQNMPEIAAWFDMSQSGAVMAWAFAHGIEHNGSPPEMLAYIQDRDLWRFAFGDRTKQFSAALRTYPMTFETWNDIANDPGKLLAEGATVLRAHTANITKFLADAYQDDVGGHRVPVVNVPYHYASDTAHALLQAYPDAPFTACWFKRGDGMIQWSLRSEDNRLDVSEIAKGYGGGGHRNAAGFQIAA